MRLIVEMTFSNQYRHKGCIVMLMLMSKTQLRSPLDNMSITEAIGEMDYVVWSNK